MFNSVKDFKDYIKQTLKSTKATTAPSQAAIYRVHQGKFQPVADTHQGGPGGDGTVIWKNGVANNPQHDLHKNIKLKYISFYLGYEDDVIDKMVIVYLHFAYDPTQIYDVGMELTYDVSDTFTGYASNQEIKNRLFQVFQEEL